MVLLPCNRKSIPCVKSFVLSFSSSSPISA